MSRLSKDQWMIELAIATSKRASCLRASVGCVLFDERGRVLATGYNGPPTGFDNCSPACPGQHHSDHCLALHSEINALMQCSKVDQIYTVATTLAPCYRCAKALLNSGMKRLLYIDAKPEFYGYCGIFDAKNVELIKYERRI